MKTEQFPRPLRMQACALFLSRLAEAGLAPVDEEGTLYLVQEEIIALRMPLAEPEPEPAPEVEPEPAPVEFPLAANPLAAMAQIAYAASPPLNSTTSGR